MSKADQLRLLDYLEHIIGAIEKIYDYIDDLDEVSFLENELVQDAVIRNFEIIGEASNNIAKYHKNFAEKYSEIPWIDMYVMRNCIAHSYFSVDLEIVWKTVQNDLPDLYEKIKIAFSEQK